MLLEIRENNDGNKKQIGNDFHGCQQKTQELWSKENAILIENGYIENERNGAIENEKLWTAILRVLWT